MKKLLTACLVLALAASMAACSGDKPAVSTDPSISVSEAEGTESEMLGMDEVPVGGEAEESEESEGVVDAEETEESSVEDAETEEAVSESEDESEAKAE